MVPSHDWWEQLMNATSCRSSRFPRSATHGAFPLRQTFCVRRRRCSWQRSEAFCCGLVPESYAPLRLLAPLRPELRSRVYPRLPLGGFRPRFVFPVARPFVCGCHTMSTSPCRLDDTRSPWVSRASSPPCRPHTPWCDGGEPCAFASIVQGRPFPNLGRPVHPGDASPRLDIGPWSRAERDFNPPETRAARHALCSIRLPIRIRRAFPVTVLLRLPDPPRSVWGLPSSSTSLFRRVEMRRAHP